MPPPPPPKEGGGEGPGPGPGPSPIPGAYEHLGADIIASMKEEAVGAQGMKIDRMLFQKLEETVKADEKIAAAVNDGKWDEVIDYVNREVFDKPEEYYTLDKLRRAAAVDRRITLREILQKVFGLIPGFKSRNDLLEEEFAKFVADHKPTEADALATRRHRMNNGGEEISPQVAAFSNRSTACRRRRVLSRSRSHRSGPKPPRTATRPRRRSPR